MVIHNIDISEDRIAEFCRKWNVIELALFGSVLRDDFGPDSDIDVLVKFKAGFEPGFLRLARMERELLEIIGNGRKIDIRTPGDLSEYFRDDVISSAEVVYAEG